MPITFITKKSPSNKAQTPAENASLQTIPSSPQTTPTTWAPTPLIDKLTLVLDPHSDAEGHIIFGAIFSVLDDC